LIILRRYARKAVRLYFALALTLKRGALRVFTTP